MTSSIADPIERLNDDPLVNVTVGSGGATSDGLTIGIGLGPDGIQYK